MYQLCVCEKPSVAKDIASAIGATNYKKTYFEGNGYLVTWAAGHLLQLDSPDKYKDEWKAWRLDTLPMLPDTFQRSVMDDKTALFGAIRSLIQRKDVSCIINCGDAGREGELIQRTIYEAAGNTHPVKRLWLSSFTKQEIQKGFQHLVDESEFDGFYHEADARSKADWLIGLNFTRLITLKCHADRSIPVGRVQTPTLKLIYDREEEIEHFQPETYFDVVASFQEGFQAKWFRKDQSSFKKKEDAMNMIALCKHKNGVITDLSEKRRQTPPPLLYSLDMLQKEANQMYGYGAEEVLSIAQSLYETHKITTYPRTDSNYLSTEMKMVYPSLIKGIAKQDKYAMLANELEDAIPTSRMINDAKITDHHAIIVTDQISHFSMDVLSQKEKNILNMIICRMLAAVSPYYQYDETNLTAIVENETFGTKTKKVVDFGFRKVESFLLGKKLPSDTESFSVKKGDMVFVSDMELQEKQTQPKKWYTEGSLIDAMVNIQKSVADTLKEAVKGFGLGTVATRGAIIEKLKKDQFVTIAGTGKTKYVRTTDLGRKLLEVVPESISSPNMTAKMEEYLAAIESGAMSSEEFLNIIKTYVNETVSAYLEKETNVSFSTKTSMGVCPFCGGKVVAIKGKGYACEERCGFGIWQKNSFFERNGHGALTEKEVKELLKNGKLKNISFVSKAGKPYVANVSVQWGNPFHKYELSFPEPETKSVGTCPFCGKKVIKIGDKGYACEEKCGFGIWHKNSFFERNGHGALTEKEVMELLKNGELKNVSFVSKMGKPYTANVTVQWGNPFHKYELSFPEPEKKAIGTCPFCGKEVIKFGNKGYACEEKCGFAIWNSYFEKLGHGALTEKEATSLLKNGTLKNVSFVSRAGKPYTANVMATWERPYPKYELEFSPKK